MFCCDYQFCAQARPHLLLIRSRTKGIKAVETQIMKQQHLLATELDMEEHHLLHQVVDMALPHQDKLVMELLLQDKILMRIPLLQMVATEVLLLTDKGVHPQDSGTRLITDLPLPLTFRINSRQHRADTVLLLHLPQDQVATEPELPVAHQETPRMMTTNRI